ncbi:MAG: hypothetical protein WB471_04605 [Nocardioides sp.]
MATFVERSSQVVAMALCLPFLAACSEGESDPPLRAQSSATSNEPTEAHGQGDHISALLGTWDYEFDRAERRAILENFSGLVDNADQVVARLAFVDDEEWWQGFFFDGELFLLDGVPEGDGGTYTIDGDQLATTGAHGETLVTYDWKLQGKTLTLTAFEECSLFAGDKTGCIRDRADMDPMMRLVTERAFTRSGSDVTY